MIGRTNPPAASGSCRTRLAAVCLTLAAFALFTVPEPTLADDGDLKIGGSLPQLPELTAVDSSTWNASEFADAKVRIIVFTCNRCPYAVDYEDRLNALHQFCSDTEGAARLLVINSNYGRDESLERMAERAKESEFHFSYVKDADQSVARSFGAVYTPEFFVFDSNDRLVYKGALDDSTNAEEAKTNYVTDAVSAILTGEPVETAEVGARGCTIRFKRRRR